MHGLDICIVPNFDTVSSGSQPISGLLVKILERRNFQFVASYQSSKCFHISNIGTVQAPILYHTDWAVRALALWFGCRSKSRRPHYNIFYFLYVVRWRSVQPVSHVPAIFPYILNYVWWVSTSYIKQYFIVHIKLTSFYHSAVWPISHNQIFQIQTDGNYNWK